MTFDPVPLRIGERDARDHRAIERELRGWAMSEPMRALAASSGWAWPDANDTLAVLDRLADLSADWDFRGNLERDFTQEEVNVRARVLTTTLIADAAQALGLVHADPLPERRFSHLVVLAGLVRGCINRTHHAAELVRGGVRADTVVALGAHRALSPSEAELAATEGLGVLTDEAEVILAATRRAFGLEPPSHAEEPSPPPPPEQWEEFHAASARYRWPSVDVVVAPSSEPRSRRANTADQLTHWADSAGLNSRHDVLMLTTQVYLPYQRMEAVRILGLRYGCNVYACGVDQATAVLPGQSFSSRVYLQEIRSALRSAATLLRVARQAPRS